VIPVEAGDAWAGLGRAYRGCDRPARARAVTALPVEGTCAARVTLVRKGSLIKCLFIFSCT
jgi:hypothetical protein